MNDFISALFETIPEYVNIQKLRAYIMTIVAPKLAIKKNEYKKYSKICKLLSSSSLRFTNIKLVELMKVSELKLLFNTYLQDQVFEQIIEDSLPMKRNKEAYIEASQIMREACQ
jgi:hypothetical protein